MSRNLGALSSRLGSDRNLFEERTRLGWTTQSAEVAELRGLADRTLVGLAPLAGAAAFYDFFRRQNTGKKAYVCNGSACLVAGTHYGVRERLQEHFAAGEICCLGRCHETAVFHGAGRNYSGDTAASLEAVDRGAQGDHADHYRTGANLDEPFLMSEARRWP